MSLPKPNARPSDCASRRAVLWAGGVIVLAALAAYWNSLPNSFVFDDGLAIRENPTIRQFWPMWDALAPPADGSPVDGRPVVNLTLAVNYAISGPAVWSYHAMNLAIHILAGLTLFGVVRRTLLLSVAGALPRCTRGESPGETAETPPGCLRTPAAAWPFALAVAVLWTVHPLQTESVTYIVQRAESLMGLFLLLTLYSFVRHAECQLIADKTVGGRGAGWAGMAVGACLLGMATKEVMVSTPVLVLLYDRTFVAGSFRAAWRQHGRLHAALAATWPLLFWLVLGSGGRAGSAGFGSQVSWWHYVLTQFAAIVHYLWLSFWPHPLVFDYGMGVVQSIGAVGAQAVLLALLAAGTLVALWRRPALGFLGVWFWALLAPSSSVVPVATQTMAEHRMYLPLAAVIVFTLAGLSQALGRRGLVVVAVLVVALGWRTVQRNGDYRSNLTIWTDTVAKRPGNERAHYNLGNALVALGRDVEAIPHYERALQIQPAYGKASLSLGSALLRTGRVDDAIRQFERTLRINPAYAEAYSNLGVIYCGKGRMTEGVRFLEQALLLKPGLADAHYNLGNARLMLGDPSAALGCYEQAVRIKPDYAEAHNNLGTALLRSGRVAEAREHYAAALRLKPDYPEARDNLAGLPTPSPETGPKP